MPLLPVAPAFPPVTAPSGCRIAYRFVYLSFQLGMTVEECPPRVCIVSFGDFCILHTCGFCTFPILCSCLRPGCGSPTPQLSHIHWWPSYIVLSNKKGWRSFSGQKCVVLWGEGLLGVNELCQLHVCIPSAQHRVHTVMGLGFYGE